MQNNSEIMNTIPHLKEPYVELSKEKHVVLDLDKIIEHLISLKDLMYVLSKVQLNHLMMQRQINLLKLDINFE